MASKKAAAKVVAKGTSKAAAKVEAATPLKLGPAVLREIKVADLKPGPFQYRRFLDEAALEDLTASVKRMGVHTPITVRKNPKGAGYQIIAGERRWRAAKAAGLLKIAALARDGISDDAAYEITLSENIDRSDPHPLDECDAFVEFRRRFGLTAEQLAARFGKGLPYVHARLALEHLGDAGRKAMLDGKFGIEVGRAFAQVRDPKLQAQAVKELTSYASREAPLTTHNARDNIKRRFMLRIVDATFDTADTTMPGGACGPCPKRSGNQGELFAADFGRDNMCTDPGCWDTKVEEFWKRTVVTAKKDGVRILGATEAKELFPYSTAGVHSRTWVDLNATSMDLHGKTWSTVLGKQREAELAKRPGAVALVRSPAGTVYRVALLAEIKKVAKAHPRSSDPDVLKPSKPGKKGAKGEPKAADVGYQVRDRAAQIALTTAAWKLGEAVVLRAIIVHQLDLADLDDNEASRVATMFGLESSAIESEAAKLDDVGTLAALAFTVTVWTSYDLAPLLEKMGVDVASPALIAQAKAELAAEVAAQKAARKGKAAAQPEEDADGEPSDPDDEDE